MLTSNIFNFNSFIDFTNDLKDEELKIIEWLLNISLDDSNSFECAICSDTIVRAVNVSLTGIVDKSQERKHVLVRGAGENIIALSQEKQYNTLKRIRILKCGHVLCFNCVYKWLILCNKTCPYCRFPLEDDKYLEISNFIISLIVRKPTTLITYNSYFGSVFLKMILAADGCMIKYIDDQTNEYMNISLNSSKGRSIKYFKNQTLQAAMHSISLRPKNFKYLTVQHPEVCELAVKLRPKNIKHLYIQKKKLIIMALRRNGIYLQYVKKKCNKFNKIAVDNNGLALLWVSYQNPILCKRAINNTPWALEYIESNNLDLATRGIQSKIDTFKCIQEWPDLICHFFPIAVLKKSSLFNWVPFGAIGHNSVLRIFWDKLKETNDINFLSALYSHNLSNIELFIKFPKLIKNNISNLKDPKRILSIVIEEKPEHMQYVPEQFHFREVAYASIGGSKYGLKYLSNSLDYEMCKVFVTKWGCDYYLPEKFVTRELMWILWKKHKYFSRYFNLYADLLYIALCSDGRLLRNLSLYNRGNYDFCMAATKTRHNSLQYTITKNMDRSLIESAIDNCLDPTFFDYIPCKLIRSSEILDSIFSKKLDLLKLKFNSTISKDYFSPQMKILEDELRRRSLKDLSFVPLLSTEDNFIELVLQFILSRVEYLTSTDATS